MIVVDALLILLVLTLATGGAWAAIRAADGAAARRSAVEMLGLSIAGGLGLFGLFIVWCSMAGLAARPAAGGSCLLAIASVAWGIARARRTRSAGVAIEPVARGRYGKVLLTTLALIAAFPILKAAADCWRYPAYDGDALAIWLFKAKVLYAAPITPKPPYFFDLSLSFSHLPYPLAWPGMVAGVWATLGRVDDHWTRLLQPLLYAAAAMMLYGAAAVRLGRVMGAGLAALIANTPLLVPLATSDNGDLPMLVFYLPAVWMSVQWLAHGRRGDLLLAILFNALVAQTKNEGLAVAGVNGAALVIGALWPPRDRPMSLPRALLGCAIYAIGLAVVVVPWTLWAADIPRTDEAYGQRLSPAALWDARERIVPVLWAMGQNVLTLAKWGFAWLLLPVIAVLGRSGFARREVVAAWVMLVGHVASYVAAYAITPWDLPAILHTSLDRVMAHVVPAVFVLIILHAAHVGAPRRATARHAESE